MAKKVLKNKQIWGNYLKSVNLPVHIPVFYTSSCDLRLYSVKIKRDPDQIIRDSLKIADCVFEWYYKKKKQKKKKQHFSRKKMNSGLKGLITIIFTKDTAHINLFNKFTTKLNIIYNSYGKKINKKILVGWSWWIPRRSPRIRFNF